MKKVWVLTEDYNDYNQYGEYFVAVFFTLPTHEELIAVGVHEDMCEHVLSGGGRIKYEDRWYNLSEVAHGVNYG